MGSGNLRKKECKCNLEPGISCKKKKVLGSRGRIGFWLSWPDWCISLILEFSMCFLHDLVETIVPICEARRCSPPIHTGLRISVVQVSMAQAVAGGPNWAGDMLFGPVVFISGEKEELLGQKSWCVPKAEHQICKPHMSAPMSLQGRGVVRAGDLLLYVCMCVHIADAWRWGHKLGNPKTGLQQLAMSRLDGSLGILSV